jgi:hypothetical protein
MSSGGSSGRLPVLLTVFYEDPDDRRRAEFLYCLRRNVANDLLAEIHLFVEEPRDLGRLLMAYPLFADGKIHLIRHAQRATYRDLFIYANRCLAGRRVIIANADIYFDRSLTRLRGYDLSDELLCLSRWDVQADGSVSLFDHAESQDAWIFDAPIRTFSCDFHLGLPGCDNRLAWEAARAGLVLSNPARSLRAYHLHLSQVHRYSERQRLTGPMEAIPAGVLRRSTDVRGANAESMDDAVADLEADASSPVDVAP